MKTASSRRVDRQKHPSATGLRVAPESLVALPKRRDQVPAMSDSAAASWTALPIPLVPPESPPEYAPARSYPESEAPPHTTRGIDLPDAGFQGYFYALPGPAVEEPPPAPDPEPQEAAEQLEMDLRIPCPSWTIIGECHEGHGYACNLICRRDWCEGCGGKDGAAHQRRKAGWIPMVRQLTGMGAFVLTVPPERRSGLRSRAALGRLGTAAKRMMQRHGFERGMRRWHPFGDAETGDVLDGVDPPPFHPHLEVLIEAVWIEPEKIEAVRESWANILNVPLERANIHYRFMKRPREILHRVSYALRPIFLDPDWDQELAWELMGFHNSQSWGTWKDESGEWLPAVWEISHADDAEQPSAQQMALAEGRCPVDGSPVTWAVGVGLQRTHVMPELGWISDGAGYWTREPRPPP